MKKLIPGLLVLSLFLSMAGPAQALLQISNIAQDGAYDTALVVNLTPDKIPQSYFELQPVPLQPGESYLRQPEWVKFTLDKAWIDLHFLNTASGKQAHLSNQLALLPTAYTCMFNNVTAVLSQGVNNVAGATLGLEYLGSNGVREKKFANWNPFPVLLNCSPWLVYPNIINISVAGVLP